MTLTSRRSFLIAGSATAAAVLVPIASGTATAAPKASGRTISVAAGRPTTSP